MTDLAALQQHRCDVCASFFARGYAFGSTGNLSIRDGDDVWVTPARNILH